MPYGESVGADCSHLYIAIKNECVALLKAALNEHLLTHTHSID